jgi:hypothetical protein
MSKITIKLVKYAIPLFIGNTDNTDLQITTVTEARLT